jgi:hypothetical protein
MDLSERFSSGESSNAAASLPATTRKSPTSSASLGSQQESPPKLIVRSG